MRRSRHGVLRTAVCAAVLFGAVAARARSEDVWQAPADLSPAEHVAAHPKLAIDSHGNQVVVWEEIATGTQYAAMAAVRSASTRTWGPAAALSSTPANAFGPVVAIDAAGNALAAWSLNGSSVPTGSAVQLAAKPAGTDWEPAFNLSPPDEFAYQPALALNEQGDALVAWVDSPGSNQSRLVVANKAHTSCEWRAPIQLSQTPNEGVGTPGVALDGQGDAVVVWTRFLSGSVRTGSTYAVEATSRRGAAADWQTPVRIGIQANAGGTPFLGVPRPHVALDAHGNAFAIWQAPDPSGSIIVQSAVKPHDSDAWQAPVTLSGLGEDGQLPQLAVDRAGDAVAVWQGSFGTGVLTRGSARSAGSNSWSAPATISPSGADNFQPEVAVDSDGNAIAIWARSNSRGYLIQAARRPAATRVWQSPTALSTPDDNNGAPSVGFDPRGNALAVWVRPHGHGNVIEAAARDITPAPPPAPNITNVRVSPRRFKRGHRTTVIFTLSRRASVRIEVTRLPAPNGCPAAGSVGRLVRKQLAAGPNRLVLGARAGRLRLRPGRYALRVVASNNDGTSAPLSASFRIVR